MRETENGRGRDAEAERRVYEKQRDREAVGDREAHRETHREMQGNTQRYTQNTLRHRDIEIQRHTQCQTKTQRHTDCERKTRQRHRDI